MQEYLKFFGGIFGIGASVVGLSFSADLAKNAAKKIRESFADKAEIAEKVTEKLTGTEG